MVAIIHCSPDEEEHVEFYQRVLGMDFPEWTWWTNRPRRLWTSGAHLTLIVTGSSRGNPEISHLAWAKRVRQIDDLNQKLEVSRIYTVEPMLPISQLFSAIPNKNMQHLRQDGQQTDGTGRALLEAMFFERPDWRPIADRIQALSSRHPIGTTASAQILAQQRDASIGISRMAGFNLVDLGSWQPAA